jgi:TPR repeat protein
VTEKVNFQIVPVQDGASIAQSEVRSSLIARGRKDASTLLTGRPKLKLPAASYYVGKSGLIDRGDAFTQFQIGYAYQNGLGIPQDYALAVEWYLKSAKQGMGRAQWKLGTVTEKEFRKMARKPLSGFVGPQRRIFPAQSTTWARCTI